MDEPSAVPVSCIFGDLVAPPHRSLADVRKAPVSDVPSRIRRAAAGLYLHDLDGALAEFDEVADDALVREDSETFGLCLLGKSLAYYFKGAFDASLRTIDRVKDKSFRLQPLTAAALLARAKIASRRGTYADAESQLAKARELLVGHDITSEEISLATELFLLTAQNEFRNDRRAAGLEAYQQAFTLAERRQYAMGMGRSLRGQAILTSIDHQQNQTFALLRRALKHFEEIGYPLGLIETHVSLGRNYFSLGELEQADFHYHEADRACEGHNVVQSRSETQARLGDVYMARGDYQSALDTYRRARSLLEGSEVDVRALGRAHRDVGRVERLMGNPAAAERDLASSIDCFRRAGNSVQVGYSLLEMARALIEGGKAAPALERVREAREIFRAKERTHELALADLVEGMCLRETRQFERARTLLLRVKRALDGLPPTFRLAEVHYELSLLDEAQGDREALFRSLRQAIRYARLTKSMDLEMKYLERLAHLDQREWMKTAYEVLVVAPEEYEHFLRGGERVPTEVATLFVDIRGYTSLAEGMPSEKIGELINEYLDLMSRTALKWGGRVIDFYGDGMLVIYSLEEGQGAAGAVESALSMHEAIGMLNERKRGVLTKPLAIGVGIHAGRVLAGFFGSQQRKKFTVIGDPVNVAARLSANAAGGEVLVSRELWDRVKEKFEGDRRGAITVKGRTESIETTRVVGRKN